MHIFDNGIKVFEKHLLDIQKKRYKKNNVHEAEEESIFIDIVNNLSKNSIYVNVGAAVGYYPLLIKSIREDIEVHAFEPLKMHRNYFYENIKLNGFKTKDFIIHNEAIYKRNGLVNFMINHYGSTIKEDTRKKTILKKIKEYLNNTRVKCITLEKMIYKIGKDIDFLQMDIQGLELEVLEASQPVFSKGKIKKLLIGTHSQKIHQRCLNILEKNGYQVLIDNYNTKLQPDGILMAEFK